MFGYDAASVFSDTMFDIGRMKVHAGLGPQTQLISVNKLSTAINAIGGANIFFPLLLPFEACEL